MPTAGDAIVGDISPGPVRRSQRNERSPSVNTEPLPDPATRSRSVSPPARSGQTNEESSFPLPDPISATEPIAADSEFAILHYAMEKAMVEAAAMLLGHMPIGAGWYLDTQEKYLAATDVLPYCPHADCGVGDRFAMLYFRTYEVLNEHIRLCHPEVETTYQPPKKNYHAMLRLLGF